MRKRTKQEEARPKLVVLDEVAEVEPELFSSIEIDQAQRERMMTGRTDRVGS